LFYYVFICFFFFIVYYLIFICLFLYLICFVIFFNCFKLMEKTNILITNLYFNLIINQLLNQLLISYLLASLTYSNYTNIYYYLNLTNFIVLFVCPKFDYSWTGEIGEGVNE
jgi:hypothetical protein